LNLQILVENVTELPDLTEPIPSLILSRGTHYIRNGQPLTILYISDNSFRQITPKKVKHYNIITQFHFFLNELCHKRIGQKYYDVGNPDAEINKVACVSHEFQG
jgi:hypothetical protein